MPAGDLEVLRELNLNYVRSVRESDARWFEEHLTGDFMNMRRQGRWFCVSAHVTRG